MAQPIEGLAWFDVPDPASPELDELAKRFNLHELEIEDCRHRPQRPKVQEHESYQFCVLKHLHHDQALSFDDLDVFIGRDFMVTVHDKHSAAIARIAARAKEEGNPRLDRVFYFVLDEIVDEYLPELDRIADKTSDIEGSVLTNPSPELLRNIFELKRGLITFRRVSTSMREVVNTLVRREHGILSDDLDPYLRDVYDHLIRITDLTESYRDLLTGSLDIYLSAVANRTNEVMKVLTVYGTVALPLVIITGFFGMNLPLPWQHTHHGLLFAVGVMALSTGLVLLYFRRKGWF
jgi:magnesium transporter